MYETKQKRKHWNEQVQWGLIPQTRPSHSLLYIFNPPPLKKQLGKCFGPWQTSTVAQVSASSSVEKPGSHLKHAAKISFRPGTVLHSTSTPILGYSNVCKTLLSRPFSAELEIAWMPRLQRPQVRIFHKSSQRTCSGFKSRWCALLTFAK